MSGKDLILDFSEYDVNHVVAGLEEIRRYNLQRYEMEQLTAICHVDEARKICAGYKDVTLEEFWVRGHMPKAPLMPGVIICEVAAQLASYFVQKYDLLGAKVVGFRRLGRGQIPRRGGAGRSAGDGRAIAEGAARGDDCVPVPGLCRSNDGGGGDAEGHSAAVGFGSLGVVVPESQQPAAKN